LLALIIGLTVSLIPFCIAIFQSFKLLNFIEKNQAFSGSSVKALHIIKYCAAAISIIYTAILPVVYIIAEGDDAPGLILIGLAFSFAPMAVAVFVAVLEKLFQNAVQIKSENDLTV
jgi:ABC-type uncharacterized transport system permease subunit